jgi:hypothetical protein
VTLIVSVDLAYRAYRDVGIAVLRPAKSEIECAFVDAVDAGLAGSPSPDVLAEFLLGLCAELGSAVLMLDGPQAWKDPENRLEHSRICERMLHTPAKTGLPGTAKPANYLPFVAFAIAVFDALAERGCPRYAGKAPVSAQAVAIESFPMSAWKSLGIQILPAKARYTGQDLRHRVEVLQGRTPLRLTREPNHDELQALVAGLGGVGLLGSSHIGATSAGVAPFVLDGVWREGFIVNPKPA